MTIAMIYCSLNLDQKASNFRVTQRQWRESATRQCTFSARVNLECPACTSRNSTSCHLKENGLMRDAESLESIKAFKAAFCISSSIKIDRKLLHLNKLTLDISCVVDCGYSKSTSEIRTG